LPVIDESAARTVSGAGNAIFEYDGHRGGFFLVDVTAVSGTTPTLFVSVQFTIDGVTWHDLDATNARTASITATGKHLIKVYPDLTASANGVANSPLPNRHRLAWTIGGTTPNFTFSTAVDYLC
jgi:hypothetical protein